jgi:hypothetical protein
LVLGGEVESFMDVARHVVAPLAFRGKVLGLFAVAVMCLRMGFIVGLVMT